MSQLETFNQNRSLLFAIAYCMLGTLSDAEDIVQETFLRWQQAAEATVKSAKTYSSSHSNEVQLSFKMPLSDESTLKTYLNQVRTAISARYEVNPFPCGGAATSRLVVEVVG